MSEPKPWRATIDFCFVADTQDDAARIMEDVASTLERPQEWSGVITQGGSAEVMDEDDVIAGSPLEGELRRARSR